MPTIQCLPVDELTGFPNRNGLYDHVASCIRKNIKLSMIYIDINNFKYVNNLFGHNIGDESLKEISILLNGSIRRYNGMLSRLCGDEFVVVLEGAEYQNNIERIIQSILKIFNNDWMYNNISIQMTVSMGIVMYPQHGYTCEELLKNANIALYHAKKQGHNTYQLFNDRMKAMLQRKIILQDSLRQAVRNGELELHYQPIYYISDGRLRGFEVLIRWNNREFGYVSPLEFIPLAEENGTIVPIGVWLLETAIRKCAEINNTLGRPCMMSINISAVQLRQKDFIDKLEGLLNRYKIKHGLVELEITESVFIDDHENIMKSFLKAKELGVKIALDDFGTGYSSLVYLKRFPIDTLKIDKAFVSDLGKSDGQKDLFGCIIDIAHKLKMEVVSEGIETDRQLEIIKEFGCEYGQGYLFSRPMKESDLDLYLEAGE